MAICCDGIIVWTRRGLSLLLCGQRGDVIAAVLTFLRAGSMEDAVVGVGDCDWGDWSGDIVYVWSVGSRVANGGTTWIVKI